MTEPVRGEPPLGVAMVIGGGLNDKAWERAIAELRSRLDELPGEGTSPFVVGVTFIVPGEVYKPNFSGVRISSYDKEERYLEIKAALPEYPVEDARAEVIGLLYQAVEKAEQWSKRKKLHSGPLAEVRARLQAL